MASRPKPLEILKPKKPRKGDPQKARRGKSKLHHAVVYGDTHIGFQDKKALKVVSGVIQDIQPEQIVHLGDLLDCYTISDFRRDPARLSTLQDEIDEAQDHISGMRALAPKAKFTLLEGNHEHRLEKAIWTLPGAAAQLPKLKVFQKAMTWPNLLRTEDLGVAFLPYAGQSKVKVLPNIIVKHGDIVRPAGGYSAKGEHGKYGKSGISGHTHRMGAHFHRDYHGSHVWWEAGCTCQMAMEYAADPDWQQGCLVVTYEPDGNWFQIEPVYIQDGKGIWRDTMYHN
jgi:hypothetical protein